MDKFDEIYPKSSLPEWFGKYICFLAFANKEKNAVQLNAYLKRVFELKKHEYLKDHNSHMIIVSVDENGKETYGINYEYAPYTIFTACLYKNLNVEIVKSVNINELNSLIKEDFVPISAKDLVWRYSE